MGAGLPAMQTPRCFRCTELMLSQASQLPPLSEGQSTSFQPDANPVGAGLPAMQTPRCFRCTEVMLSQASQLPPLIVGQSTSFSPTLNPCGSGLARDADTSVFQVYRGDAFAGKPAPTFECGDNQHHSSRR